MAVSVIVGFYLANQSQPSPEVSPTPVASPTTPKPLNSQYLTFTSGNTSKIFLEAATTRYDTWTKNGAAMTWFTNGPIIHTGDPVFILNGTIRNDYTQTDHQRVDNSNHSTVIFNVKLYDTDGNVISALQSYPRVESNYYTSNYWYFESGKSEIYEMYFSTANRNIDRYDILVEVVASMPPP